MKPSREAVDELLKDFRLGPEGFDPEWDEPRAFSSSGRFMYYSPWGDPMSRRQFCRLMEATVAVPGAAELYMIIGRDIANGYSIRTDWMALDLNIGGHHDNIPLIFETQLFGTMPGMPLHLHVAGRYATWEGAEEGHQAAIELANSNELALPDSKIVEWIMAKCDGCDHPRGAHEDRGVGKCIGMGVGLCECGEFS